MKVIIGSDHVGWELKRELVAFLRSQGLEVTDVGTHSADPVDYPDFAYLVGQGVAAAEYDRGILICGTGLGMSIAANKIKGVRAALCHDLFTAKKSREHNDANVLVLGAWLVPPQHAFEIISTWLQTEYEGGRHGKRLEKMKQLEAAWQDCRMVSLADIEGG
ncbi:MAG: ribose 5-phosphate isomerase B [Chloroflexi bacterium]|nr:ribose 5-phosphate isomerase B [Chloroflexota bacterium]